MSTFEENLHPRRTDGRFAPKPGGASGEPDGLDLGAAMASGRARVAMMDRADALAERAERLGRAARDAREALARADMSIALTGQKARRASAVEVIVRRGENPRVAAVTDADATTRRVASFEAGFFGRLNNDPGSMGWDRWAQQVGEDGSGATRWRIDLDAARADLAGQSAHEARYGSLTPAEAEALETYLATDAAAGDLWDHGFEDAGGRQVEAIGAVLGEGAGTVALTPIRSADGSWGGNLLITDSATDPAHPSSVLIGARHICPPPQVTGAERARQMARNIADAVRLYG